VPENLAVSGSVKKLEKKDIKTLFEKEIATAVM
jgi:hypothetical protein